MLYRNFDFENFAVSHEKEIFVIDFEELNIIRNFDFDESKGENLWISFATFHVINIFLIVFS